MGPTQWFAGLPLEKGKHLCQHGHRPLLLHLRQRRLGLGQPEGHCHLPVEREGRRQLSAGLLPLTGRGIQCAKVAVMQLGGAINLRTDWQ